MEITKLLTDSLEAAYAVCRLEYDDFDYLLVASEINGECFAYDLNNNFAKKVVWKDVGGTMSIVQVPDSLDFLATQKFYPGFDAKDCQIVYGRFNGESWDVSKIKDFSYLHRFDLIRTQTGDTLFVGCTIAKSKSFVEDWSDKGEIFVGKFNTKSSSIECLKQLPLRLLKNHGYYSVKDEGYSLITAVEGVFKLIYPDFSNNGDWCLTKLFDHETSDITQLDIDNDGNKENMIIQGFHGNDLNIFSYDFTEKLYQYPEKTPFGHSIWSGTLSGVPCFVFGWRSGKADLCIITYNGNEFSSHLVESGVASSNCLAFDKDGESYIFSANNGSNQVVLYKVQF